MYSLYTYKCVFLVGKLVNLWGLEWNSLDPQIGFHWKLGGWLDDVSGAKCSKPKDPGGFWIFERWKLVFHGEFCGCQFLFIKNCFVFGITHKQGCCMNLIFVKRSQAWRNSFTHPKHTKVSGANGLKGQNFHQTPAKPKHSQKKNPQKHFCHSHSNLSFPPNPGKCLKNPPFFFSRLLRSQTSPWWL